MKRVAAIVMMLTAGIAVGYVNSASAKVKHPPGCSRVKDPTPGYVNQVPCPVRDPLAFGFTN